MTDKEPTQEQVKEFWEWCGFRQNTALHQDYHYEFTKKVGNWHRPDGLTTFDQIQKGNLPNIDLNNLFKYAVPKLNGTQKARLPGIFSDSGRRFVFHWFWDNPALALFWAIYSVITS